MAWRYEGEEGPFLLPHLLESVSNIKCTDLFVVLKLEELITSVPGHVNEDIGSIIGQEPFRSRYRRVNST